MTYSHEQFSSSSTGYQELAIKDVVNGYELRDEAELAEMDAFNKLMGSEDIPGSIEGKIAQFKAVRFQNPGMHLRIELPTQKYPVYASKEGLEHTRHINRFTIKSLRTRYGIKADAQGQYHITPDGVQKVLFHKTGEDFAFVELSSFNDATNPKSTRKKFPDEYRLFVYGLDQGVPRGEVDVDELLSAY